MTWNGVIGRLIPPLFPILEIDPAWRNPHGTIHMVNTVIFLDHHTEGMISRPVHSLLFAAPIENDSLDNPVIKKMVGLL